MTPPLPPRTVAAIRDLLEFSDWAADLVADGQDSYRSSRLAQLAAEALVLRIGEAASRVDPNVVADHPEIPLARARAIRNLVAHEHQRVDPHLVWGVLADRVPALARQLRELLELSG